MSIGTFKGKNTPNKQIVMNDMYHFASKYIHRTDVVILPATFPFRPLRRLFRYGIIGTSNFVDCYELSDKIFKGWHNNSKPDSKRSINTAIKRLIAAGYPGMYGAIRTHHDNVVDAPNTRFKDLDFCSTWLATRDIKKGEKDPLSPLNILRKTILAQRAKYRGRWCVTLGTVSLRGGIDKEYSKKCLGVLLADAGADKADIPYDRINERIKMPGSGHKMDDGRVYKAYEYNIETYNDNVSAKCYTYKDSVQMLSFVIAHKNE